MLKKTLLSMVVVAGFAAGGCSGGGRDIGAPTPSTIGDLAPRTVGAGGAASGDATDESPLIAYDELQPCEVVAAGLSTALSVVEKPPPKAGSVVCYFDLPDPERPSTAPSAPRTGGAVYIPDGLSPEEDSIAEILEAGGILVRTRRPDSGESTDLPEGGSAVSPTGGSAAVTIQGNRGRIVRIDHRWVTAIWFARSDNGDILRFHVSGGYSPDEVHAIANRVRRYRASDLR